MGHWVIKGIFKRNAMFTSKTLFWVISRQLLILIEYNLYQLLRHKILNKIVIRKISKVELFERGAHLVSFWVRWGRSWPIFLFVGRLFESIISWLQRRAKGRENSLFTPKNNLWEWPAGLSITLGVEVMELAVKVYRNGIFTQEALITILYDPRLAYCGDQARGKRA